MKVSLRRKIHIIAFPQETLLNARWSEAQSAATPRRPSAVDASPRGLGCGLPPCGRSSGQQWRQMSTKSFAQPVKSSWQQDEPDEQQEMPVDGAQLDARGAAGLARPRRWLSSVPIRPSATSAAQHMQAVQPGDQIEEGCRPD